ncbi:MAG: AAA family ATPase [Bacteroidota bacterium]
MKIKKIEISNYKAFYKSHEFNVEGKNLFIYGENGSGKSSFYYALKDFFQSSIETINFDDVENIFLETADKGNGIVKITFNPDKDGNANDQENEFGHQNNTTYGNIEIRDAISLKGFLTYKHLLGIHHLKKDDEIDLFDLLLKGVLKHFKSVAVTGQYELGELWKRVEDAVQKPLDGQRYNRTQKSKDVGAVIKEFNDAFEKLFESEGVENILRYASPILDQFGHNIDIELNYAQARPSSNLESVERNNVRIKVKYLGQEVDKPHIFLNEARLSAIAISIYLGMIKRHIQGMPLKVLFLDDIFIGLDISNRLPLLEIIESEFPDYQVFITTYDKPWYEFVRSTYLSDKPNWKSFEFYARRSAQGFEIPIKREIGTNSHVQYFIDKAEEYYNNGDNKAAGVYLRSAFEFILKRYCFGKKVPVRFHLDISKMDTSVFWEDLKKYKITHANYRLTPATTTAIDHYTTLVLNPLSHHDINKHEVSAEIQGAIDAVKALKTELGV